MLETPGENAAVLVRATLKWRSEWLLQEIRPDHKAETQGTGRGGWGAAAYFEMGFPYMNHEIPVVQAGFIKGRGTRDQTANIHWIIEKAKEFQKNIYFRFIDYTKACVDHNKLWKILKEMGIPDHLTCLLRNLYAGQEATVRTGYGTTD